MYLRQSQYVLGEGSGCEIPPSVSVPESADFRTGRTKNFSHAPDKRMMAIQSNIFSQSPKLSIFVRQADQCARAIKKEGATTLLPLWVGSWGLLISNSSTQAKWARHTTHPTTSPLPSNGRGARGEGGSNRCQFFRSTPTIACPHPYPLPEEEGTLG